jgi:hypothetical protein
MYREQKVMKVEEWILQYSKPGATHHYEMGYGQGARALAAAIKNEEVEI